MGEQENDGWHYYAADGTEALREIEESLLSLESEATDLATINRLYRALHTLKGNSAVMGLPNIEQLAHAAEDMVGLVRDGGVTIDRLFVDLMLKVVDLLNLTVDRAGRDHHDADAQELAPVVAELKTWHRAHAPAGATPVPGAVRGDILIFSSFPSFSARPSESRGAISMAPDEDPATVELVLSFVHDTLPELAAGLSELTAEHAGTAPSRVRDIVGHIIGILARTGLERTRAELAAVMETLADESFSTDRGALRNRVAHSLIDLEDRYARAAQRPQQYGVRSALSGFLSPRTALPAYAFGDASEVVIEASVPPPAPPQPAAAPAPERIPAASRKGSSPHSDESHARADVLRIDAHKVSTVMDLAGEIGLACGAVVHHPAIAHLDVVEFSAVTHKLEMLIRELQNEVAAMRLVAVGGVFARMNRVVRDTAQRTGKKVELVLEGEETEIDKVLVDALHDPLVHVLRNAIDHGIELPEVRRAAGKDEVGRVVLAASHRGGEVCISVSDDGKGLNAQAILAKAKARGLVPADATPSVEEIFRFVFLPGFSTKENIDALSGRGVGMDVVKTAIEGYRGRVELTSTEGRGTRLGMLVPLTLAFIESMVARDGEQLYAVPIERVREVFQVEAHQLTVNAADKQAWICLRDELIPVLWLREFYGDCGPMPTIPGRTVVLVQTSRGSLALPVDALLGTQQVMLKPLTGLLANVRAGAGCGLLRSGDIALALDCERLHA